MKTIFCFGSPFGNVTSGSDLKLHEEDINTKRIKHIKNKSDISLTYLDRLISFNTISNAKQAYCSEHV
jgi:inorganic pyrophosphatase